MVYDPLQADAFLKRLLESPGERQNVDYKSSARFDGKDDSSLKLLKHIQGMANSGGGYLVIGYTEGGDKPYEPDPHHTNEIASTYDTTTVSKAVNATVARGQSVELSVYPIELKSTGLVYPIIAVQPFKRQPVVCRSTKGGLREGAVYIRRPGAETSEASTPQDWESLIDRCVERRWDDFVEQHGEMLKAMAGTTPPQQSAQEKIEEWTNKMRQRAVVNEPWKYAKGYIEISRQLLGTARQWRPRELRDAARAAESFWTVVWKPQVVPGGIEDKDAPSGAYWFLSTDGSFYFLRLFQEDIQASRFMSRGRHPNQALWYDTCIWRIAEAMLHSAGLYRALRVGPEQPFVLSVKHHGLKGRELFWADSAHDSWITRGRVSSSKQHSWYKTLTQDQVTATKRELVREVATDILELFEFAELSEWAFDTVLNKFGRGPNDKPFSH